MTPTAQPEVERRKTDLLDDPIDEDILREIRAATDDNEKRRLMIDYQINRQLWRLGSLVGEISKKISDQDTTFERHRTEIKAILDNANKEYQAHRAEFLKHATDEEKLISNGQTAYKVVAAGAAAFVALGYYIVNGHLQNWRETASDAAVIRKDLQDVRRQVDVLTDSVSRHLIAPAPGHAPIGLKAPDR